MASQTNPGSGRETPDIIKAKGGSGALPGFEGMAEHWHQTSRGSNLHFFANAPGVGPSAGPVLVLAHGWPQTSYIFRYLVPALQRRIRLFVPDQPGIAHSSAAHAADKLTLGACYVEALAAHFGRGTRVVLAGHDRGARILQRVAVSWSTSRRKGADGDGKADGDVDDAGFGEAIDVLGALFMDIVPIVAQFGAFGTRPSNAVRYFHWAFMPLPGRAAVPMIMAFGGDRWCRAAHDSAVGPDAAGARSLRAGDAVDVYAAWYAREDVNVASIDDYTAAANEDHRAMLDDQARRRKIDVPLVVLHCAGLGKMHDDDVRGIWADYVADPARLKVYAADDGYGHYLAEECPDWVIKHVEDFLTSLGL